MTSNTMKKQEDSDKKIKLKMKKDLDHLKLKIAQSEKEFGPLIFMKRDSGGDYSYEDIRKEELQLRENFNKNEKIMKSKIDKLNSEVARFTSLVRDQEMITSTSKCIGRLKEGMESIEECLSKVKEYQSSEYVTLQEQEKKVLAEVVSLADRFQNWKNLAQTDSLERAAALGAALGTSLGGGGSAPARLQDGEEPQSITDYDSYLSKYGGITGGWDDYDHQIFVKAYTRSKSRPSLTTLQTLFPSMSQQHLLQHIGWYREFRQLSERRKSAISDWRCRKEQEKQVIADQAHKQIEEEEMKREHASTMDSIKRDLLRTKNEVAEWKRERRLREDFETKARAVQEEKLRVAESRKNKKHFEDYCKRQAIKQSEECQRQLDQRHQETLDEKERKLQAFAEQRVIDQKIHKFQNRDDHIVMKKIEQVNEKEQSVHHKERRLLKIINEQRKTMKQPTRDTNRLMQQTEGSLSRANETRQERQQQRQNKGAGVNRVMSAPVSGARAVPAWRKT